MERKPGMKHWEEKITDTFRKESTLLTCVLLKPHFKISKKSKPTHADMKIEYDGRADRLDFNLLEKIICKFTSVKY